MLYGRLEPLLGDEPERGDGHRRRQLLCDACREALERLAEGRERAEEAAASLFEQIRALFDPERQLQVRLIVDLDLPSAAAMLDSRRASR